MTIFDLPTYAPSIFQIIWLVLVAVLWIGFFFFEGFDFGVGMLVPFLGKTDKERRVLINTVGPHWDGNEVWLLTAGGAMFAAFPGWYATLFSGLYLPLLLVLLGLILRGVAMEYRSKQESRLWRTVWDWLIAIGSLLPPLVFGVGFANFIIGVPLVEKITAFGNPIALVPEGLFWGLFSPFALIGGLLIVALFISHGAFFVALKTRGEIAERAQKSGGVVALVALVLAAAFVVWGNLAFWLPAEQGQLPWLKVVAWVTGAIAVLCIALAWFMNGKGRDGWAFIGSSLATVMLVVMFFAHFYPGLGFDNGLLTSVTIDLTTASSSPHTLTLMTIAAGIMTPIVLAYTAWSYFFVFKRRLSADNIPDLEVVAAA